MPKVLEFIKVSKSYNQGETVINNINFSVEKGELISLLGLSGCGKTTILKLINRLIDKDSGDIYLNGESIYNLNKVALRRRIGYVIQNTGLIPHWNVKRNITTRYEITKSKIPEDVVEKLCILVNLPIELLTRKPSELSGGQQQRVGIIRALANDPELILMDEPFSALDAITRTSLQDELIKIKSTIGKTIIFVTHDIREALKISDRIMLINNGTIEQFDTPNNLVMHPATKFVKEFMGSVIDNSTVLSIIHYLPIVHYKAWRVTAIEAFKNSDCTKLGLIDDYGKLVGVTTRAQLEGTLSSDKLMNSLLDIKLSRVPVIDRRHRDLPISDLVAKFNKFPSYVIITNNGYPEGIVYHSDIKGLINE